MSARLLLAALLTSVCSSSAGAETIVSGVFEREVADYPCRATLLGDNGTSLIVSLSDYKSVWSLVFLVSGNPESFEPYFNTHQLFDSDQFRLAIQRAKIGNSEFRLADATALIVQRSELDNDTFASFSIEAVHNVTAALQAIGDGGLSFAPFAALDGTDGAITEFQDCSYRALGVEIGQIVPTDFREEYRMIFDQAFLNWVSAMARLESCRMDQSDEGSIEDVARRGAAAFYPGITNVFRRSEYEESLLSGVPLARLKGSTDGIVEGCLFADSLAETARLPIEQAIEKALLIE